MGLFLDPIFSGPSNLFPSLTREFGVILVVSLLLAQVGSINKFSTLAIVPTSTNLRARVYLPFAAGTTSIRDFRIISLRISHGKRCVPFPLIFVLDFRVVVRVRTSRGLIDCSCYAVIFASCCDGGGDPATQSRPD